MIMLYFVSLWSTLVSLEKSSSSEEEEEIKDEDAEEESGSDSSENEEENEDDNSQSRRKGPKRITDDDKKVLCFQTGEIVWYLSNLISFVSSFDVFVRFHIYVLRV